MKLPKIIQKVIQEDGFFPNNDRLPLLLYKSAFGSSDLKPEFIESLFFQNGWKNAWRNGIYNFHHYHSNTHEVLGVYSGTCAVQVGGEKGEVLHLEKGDILIIPVGVSHKNVECSEDFKCIGAYPLDIAYDMNYGKSEEKEAALEKIQNTPLPKTDPVFGDKGPLFEAWEKAL